ncbi:MAG: phage tail assembly protein [Verrucomicrobiae bacterium]|nr:phage tail assembly protein [Verrucomicrobiae bacterium]
MDEKSTTLFGGRTFTVKFEDDTTGELTVRQFKVREYPVMFPVADNEFELLARACSVPVQKIQALTPADYERLQAALQEVNKDGFFTYADRQMERGRRNLQNLPAAMLEKMFPPKPASTSSMSPMTMPPPAG